MLLQYLYTPTFAQNLPVIVEPTSEAIGLGVVGNLPVSLYTGAVNIEIPLFENVIPKGSPISIKLKYNSSGVIPTMRSGWVGQNWTLEAGGVITRNVRGLPDEISYFRRNKNDLLEDNWYGVEKLEGIWLKELNENLSGIVNEPKDFSSDEYFLSAPGLNVKFYLGADDKFHAIGRPGVKIEAEFETNPYNYSSLWELPPHDKFESTCHMKAYPYKGFKVTTEEGFVYSFGYGKEYLDVSTTYNKPYAPIVTSWLGTSWHLASVVYPDHSDYIHFNYSKKYLNYTLHDHEEYSGNLATTMGCRGGKLETSVSVMYHSYLEKISTSQFEIRFSTNPSNSLKFLGYPDESQLLSLISLTYDKNNHNNSSYRVGRVYEFRYYDNRNNRPFLTSLTETDARFGSMPPYKFEYHDLEALPATYRTKAIDHWGYYNGNNNNNSYIPGEYDFEEDEHASKERETDEEYSKKGSLVEIKYPSGGRTILEYESNDYKRINFRDNDKFILKERGNNKKAAGLRIKRIKYLESQGANPITYEYNYNIFGTTKSSGILSRPPIYHFNVKQNDSDILGEISSKAFSYIYLSEGMPIGYSEVTEKIYSEDENSINGLTKYTYSNFDTDQDLIPIAELSVLDPSVKNAFAKSNSQNYRRGILNTKEVFSKTGDILEKYEYKYENYNQASLPDILTTTRQSICTISDPYTSQVWRPLSIIDISASYLNLSIRNLTEEKRKSYRGNLVIENTTTYKYNEYNQIKEINRWDSAGDHYVDKYEYVSDYLNDYKEIISECNKSLDQTVEDCIKESEKVCMHMYETDSKSYYECIHNSKIDCHSQRGNFYDSCVKNHIETHNLDQIVVNMMLKNLLTTKLKESRFKKDSSGLKVLSSNIYEYKYWNQGYKLTNNFQFVSNKIVYENSLSKEHYELESSYSYNEKSTIRDMKLKDGMKICTLWGYNSLFPIAEIKNATYQEILDLNIPNLSDQHLNRLLYTTMPSSAELDEVNSLRVKLPNSIVTTYTYEPLIGILSMTDPRGVTTYYDYDGFGRLIEIYRMENGKKKVVKTHNYNYRNQ